LHLETFVRSLDRAIALLRGDMPEEASVLLETAVGLFPDNLLARQLLAMALFRIGKLERALVIYESVLGELPGCSAAKVNVALVLLKLGRPFAAKPLLEEVVHACPLHHRAWGYLGVVLEQLGLVREAYSALLAGGHAEASEQLRERHPTFFGGMRITVTCSLGHQDAAPVPRSNLLGPGADHVAEIPLGVLVSVTATSHGSLHPLPHLQAALSSLTATWEDRP
jgi:tetratricopeptide (TPR) repeat protein